jgi:UDP-glucuronate decarboxylase
MSQRNDQPEGHTRTLVTGGAGFIGANLCRALVARGEQVVCLDSFVTSSRENVSDLERNPAFSLLCHDVTEPIPLTAERVYNLACPASPPRYQADPIHTFRSCVFGVFNVIETVARTNGRIVQASTSEVYGEPLVHPQCEEYRGNVDLHGVRACYDEGKRAAETVLFDHRRVKGLDIGVARIFNTYGPFMDPFDGRVVTNFIRQVLQGQPLTIYGDGTQTRSLCYVSDLVEGLIALMDAGRGTTGPINLGNPVEVTVIELAETVCALTGAKRRFEFLPLPQGDPSRRRPTIDRAAAELGWRPRTPLEAGLSKTIDFIDARLAASAAVGSP